MPIKWPTIEPFDPRLAVTGRHARRTDPDTSHAGARRVARRDREAVRAAYERAGLEGLTDRELQAQGPQQVLARQESWRKRRSDLTRAGVLYDSGERRDRQIVWRVRPVDASGEAALF